MRCLIIYSVFSTNLTVSQARLEKVESLADEFLCSDSQVRYRWSVNDVAIWDNRSTTHGESQRSPFPETDTDEILFFSCDIRLLGSSRRKPSRRHWREAVFGSAVGGEEGGRLILVHDSIIFLVLFSVGCRML